MIIVVFILLPNDLFAQEETETPVVPTVTATLTPTVLPTLTATVAPATLAPSPTETVIVPEVTAEVASDTPAPEVTDTIIEPTLELTNTAQAEVTDTVASSSEQTEVVLQEEPEPELTAVVSEPFLSQTNTDWSFGNGWQLVPLDGTYALQANGITQPVTYTQTGFSDVAVEAIVQTQHMTIELYIRQSDLGSYRLVLSPDGVVEIYKGNTVLASTIVASSSPNQWRNIRLSAMGHTLRASIDNIEVLVNTDTQPLPVGTVSFIATTSSTVANQTLLLDNVRIWIPSVSIDNATETPTATYTEILPTEQFIQLSTNNFAPNWDELWYSDFEKFNLELESWDLGTSATYFDGPSGKALELTGGDNPLIFNFDRINNVAIEADIYMATDSNPVSLTARESTSGYYLASITSTGDITLQRGQTIVATNTIQNFTVDTWHHVRMEVYNDTIRIIVNNMEILAVQDMNPLPMGRVIISDNTLSTDTFNFDNIQLSMPYEEIPWRTHSNSTSEFRTSDSSTNVVAFSAPPSITVGTVAGLRQAITNCSGSLVIGLSQNITFTDADLDDTYGDSALPPIYCDLTILGNGYIISRSTIFTTPLFRIFAIDYVGKLTLDDVKVYSGRIQRGFGSSFYNQFGAGIYNLGVLILQNNTSIRFNMTISSSYTTNYFGGGVYSAGILEVYEGVNISSNSMLLNSSASLLQGTGIYAKDLLIQGSPTNPVIVSYNGHNSAVYAINSDDAIINYLEMTGNFWAILGNDNLSINNSVISDNKGGIEVGNYNGVTQGVVSNSIIANNSLRHTLIARTSLGTATLTVSNSCITGNQGSEFYVNIQNITAENNWWGDPLGPGNEAGSTGDIVENDVDYDPWLTTKPTLNLWGNECENTTPNVIQVSNPSLQSNSQFGFNSLITTSSIVEDPNDNTCTLREAIEWANGIEAEPACDPIETDNDECEGTYCINLYPATYFYAEALPVINSNIHIRVNPPPTDPPTQGTHATIERLDTASDFRIFDISDGSVLILENIIVSNGVAPNGGGIWNDGTLTLINGAVINNEAADSGGGIYNTINGKTTIEDSIIANNSAMQYHAIQNANANGEVNITNSCINQNSNAAYPLSYAVGGQPISATLNWWGDSAGPSVNGSTNGDLIEDAKVNFSSYLTSSPDLELNAYCLTILSIDPTELAYYETFSGVVFWIIFNETSDNGFVDQFNVIEPLATNANPNDQNRIVLVPPTTLPQQQRSARYLIARTILDNVPAYSAGNENNGYQLGFGYTSNWGGSIGNADYHVWQNFDGCLDTHVGGNLLSYDSVSGDKQRLLEWFSDIATCFATNPNFAQAYLEVNTIIDSAILDHINGVANPVAGAYFIRHANSCFIFDSGGGCLRTRAIQNWCNEANLGRDCRSYNRFVQETDAGSVSVNINDWYSYNLVDTYTNPSNPGNFTFNSTFLFNPSNEMRPQQIVYNTTIGADYHFSTGLYTQNGSNLFFLMGEGHSQISEDLDTSFIRHWNRLNRDRQPLNNPETFRPGTCVHGMAHGTLDQTWVTFTFQDRDQAPIGGDVWFCTAQ